MTVRNDKTAKNTGSGEPVTADDAAGSRAPAFVRRSRPLHLTWQVAIFLAGLAVVVLGVIMLPLPGPGWVVIFLGMGVWATEFDWARLVLRWSRRKVAEAAHRALDRGCAAATSPSPPSASPRSSGSAAGTSPATAWPSPGRRARAERPGAGGCRDQGVRTTLRDAVMFSLHPGD